jgi:transmembrane protein
MSPSRHVLASSLAFRILIVGMCAPFWISGIDKVLDLEGAAKEMLGLGMSRPHLVALAVVAVQLGGSLLAIVGRGALAAAGALALAAFTVAATWVAHAFWTFHGQERFGQMNIFVEHVSIVFGLALAAWVHTRLTESPSVSSVREQRPRVSKSGPGSSSGTEALH